MGGWTGIWQWVVVLIIVLILFGGRGKISNVMGDIGKGIKSFKSGVSGEPKNDEEAAVKEAAPALKSESAQPAEKPVEPAAEASATQGRAAKG